MKILSSLRKIDFFTAFAPDSKLSFFIDDEKGRSKNRPAGCEKEEQAGGECGREIDSSVESKICHLSSVICFFSSVFQGNTGLPEHLSGHLIGIACGDNDPLDPGINDHLGTDAAGLMGSIKYCLFYTCPI